jgi:hypothetical protein
MEELKAVDLRLGEESHVRPLRPRHPETARQSLKDARVPGSSPEARCGRPTRRYAAPQI